jgi:hypothetical protein
MIREPTAVKVAAEAAGVPSTVNQLVATRHARRAVSGVARGGKGLPNQGTGKRARLRQAERFGRRVRRTTLTSGLLLVI